MFNILMKYLKLVKILIEVGVDVNMEYRKNILFSLVCMKGCIRLIDMLIKVGVNVN